MTYIQHFNDFSFILMTYGTLLIQHSPYLLTELNHSNNTQVTKTQGTINNHFILV